MMKEKNGILNAFHILNKYDNKVRQITILSVISQCINSIDYLFASVVYLKFLLYCVTEHESMRNIILSLLGITVLMAFIKFYSGWFELHKKTILVNQIEHRFSKLIYDRTYEMNLKEIQEPKHFEEYQKVMAMAKKNIVEYINHYADIIGKFLMCIMVSSVLLSIDRKSLIILILPVCTTWIIGKKYNRELYHENQKKMAGEVRKEYVKRCFMVKSIVLR